MTDPFVQSAAQALADVANRNPCKVCREILSMPDDRRKALVDLLSSKISTNRIVELCQANDVGLGENSIRRHRAAGHSA